jgi:hypothetical protein
VIGAEKLRSKLHARQDSIDEAAAHAPSASAMSMQGLSSVQMASMLSLRPPLSGMSSAGAEGDSYFHGYIPSRQRTEPHVSLSSAPASRTVSKMSSLPSMDLQIVHALSLMESSPVRHHRGSTDAPTKVIVEPRVHRCVGQLCSVSLIRVFSMLFPLAHTLVWQSLRFTLSTLIVLRPVRFHAR